MRIRNLFFLVLIAVASAIAVTVIGQEEPLPAVHPKALPQLAAQLTAVPEPPSVVLASFPLSEYHQPTIEEAARNNDYVTFDALYQAAKRRGDSVAQFATLDEVWTYSVTDPIGAFYGREMFERLSRAYTGFAKSIEPFRIVDQNGNVFYPTSETRAFLLERALAGTTPRVLLAEAGTTEDTSIALPPLRRRVVKDGVGREEGALSAVRPSPAFGTLSPLRGARGNKTRATHSEKTARDSKVARAEKTATTPKPNATSVALLPAARGEEPALSERSESKGAQRADEGQPGEKAATALTPNTTPTDNVTLDAVTKTPVVATTTPAQPPVKRIEPAPVPTSRTISSTQARTTRTGFLGSELTSRGLLLLLAGLIAVGIFAVVLRSPDETVTARQMREARVHPIRRPEPPEDEHQATGSHG